MPRPASAPPEPRSRKGQHTRERILLEATGLFAARGFAPVTMRAIGDAAGIDNSSLYRHFAGKNELAREVLHTAMADLFAEIGGRAKEAPPTLEGLVEIGVLAALHLWDHPSTARLLLHWVISAKDSATGFDVSLPIDATGTPSGELFRSAVALFVQARTEGELRAVEWPEGFVAVVGVITLRPATYRSLLASQEPVRGEKAARLAWQREVGALLRGMLAP